MDKTIIRKFAFIPNNFVVTKGGLTIQYKPTRKKGDEDKPLIKKEIQDIRKQVLALADDLDKEIKVYVPKKPRKPVDD